MKKKVLILLRHSEALKNKENKHGGLGSKLTSKGINDTKELSHFFSSLPFNFHKIIFPSKSHCKETAEILGKELSVEFYEKENLKPIYLGIIDGLSDQQVKEQYPKIHKKITAWRNGNIEINELTIPEMEDQSVFYERGRKIVQELLENEHSYIVILTRSLLVLLTNVLLNRTTRKGGNYREIKWDNLGFAVFIIDEFGVNFNISLSSVII